MNSDNKFVFKIIALHCTPLEFRIGFLVGGAFNLKVEIFNLQDYERQVLAFFQ